MLISKNWRPTDTDPELTSLSGHRRADLCWTWEQSPFLKPLTATGLYFQRFSIRSYEQLPDLMRIYGASWFGTGDTTAAGAMAHAVVAKDKAVLLFRPS